MESTDSHTSFTSQSHLDSQTLLESQDSLDIENNTESFNSHNTIQSVESKNRDSHTTESHLIQSQAKRDSKDSQTILESLTTDSQTILESQRDSKEKEEVTQRVSQTNTESTDSHTSLHNTLFNKLLTLRNLFIVAFLSGIWHGAGWGFVIWGIMHGIAMCVHRIYMWWVKELEKKCSLVGENDCLHYAHISKASSHSTDVAGDLVRDVARDLADLKVAITNEATPIRYPAKNSANTIITHICISKSNNTQSTPNQVQDSQIDSQSKTITESHTDSDSRFKDLDLQSESKVYTESNPTNPKTITQSTPNQVQDSQIDSQSKTITESHTDSQPNKIHNPYSFARFYTALRHTRLYTLLCWFLTFNFVNIAWIFFRAENIQGACNLLKGMFGITWVELPPHFYRAGVMLAHIGGTDRTLLYIFLAFIIVLMCKNGVEQMRHISNTVMFCVGVGFGFLIITIYTKTDTPPFLYFNF